MSTYDWSQFHVRMYYLAPLDVVYRYFSTAAGLEAFFIREARHTTAEGRLRGPEEPVATGDEYHWTYMHDFAHGGRFELVDPDRAWNHPNWNDSVSIGFDPSADPGEPV